MRISADKDFGARECPSCACEVPANTNRCPVCGYPYPQPTSTQKGMRIWGAVIMLGLLLLLILLGVLR